jgi:hypothetical protein
VARAELDLLEPGATLQRQLGEGPPAVVRRDLDANGFGVGRNHVGDRLRAHAGPKCATVALAQRAEHMAVDDAGAFGPCVDGDPGPIRHRH